MGNIRINHCWHALAAIIDDLYNEMDDLEDEMAFAEEEVSVCFVRSNTRDDEPCV